MKAFITGGSGFLGRNLISYSLSHGDTIVALSRSSRSDELIQNAAHPHTVTVVRGDLTDTTILADAMKGCDITYHVAGKVEDWGVWDDFYQANVVGTQNVIKATRIAGVGRLVHVGTEAVCLNERLEMVGLTEEAPLEPPSWAPYSRSKALAEEEVIKANGDGLVTVVVRPRLIWGKGDTVILKGFVNRIKSGAWKWIGKPYKTSTCNVINVCEGMRLAAEKGKGGEKYFLTDGEPIDFEEFVTKYVATQGVEMPANVPRVPFGVVWALATVQENLPFMGYGITREPLASRQALGLIMNSVTVVDTKARKELGYKGSVSFEEGLMMVGKVSE